MYDDDIAQIKAHVLRQEADKIKKIAEQRTCACDRLGGHHTDCPVAVMLQIAHMLRMDSEG